MQALPAADLRFFDGGHFVLDEYAYPIAQAIVEKFSGSNDAR
jgi:surfactin synthase thioesterase subunit